MHTNWKMFTIFVFAMPAAVLLLGMLIFNINADDQTAEDDFIPEETVIELDDSYRGAQAIIETDKGSITLELYLDDAPKTVTNFVKLAEKGYYDGLKFHRVIDGFMIQTGDPQGTGSGGQSVWSGSFEDEINAASLGLDQTLVKDAEYLTNMYDAETLAAYADRSVMDMYVENDGYAYNAALASHRMVPGALAMANSGPATNGSQFFIVTDTDQPHLDGKHTVFGQVSAGLDVAQSIEQDDVMNAVRIVKKAATEVPAAGETIETLEFPVTVE